MTNSPPPEPPSRRRILRRDELIAIIVALASIGSILFWVIGRKDYGFNLNSWLSTPIATQRGSSEFGFGSETNTATKGIGGGLPSWLIGEQTINDDETDSLLADGSGIDSDVDESVFSIFNLPFSKDRVAFPETEGITSLDGTDSNDSATDGAEGTDGDGTDDTDSATEASPKPTAEASPTPNTSKKPKAEASPTPNASEEPTAVAKFSDIKQEYWAQPFISALVEKSAVSGFPDDTFQPERQVTRAELASVIQTVLDRQESQSTISFPDIPEDYWATTAIDRSVKTGFMKGYAEGEFRPEQKIPRVQVLVALVTGLNIEPKSATEETLELYQDGDQIPDWAKEKIVAATEAGLVVNYPNTKRLNPNKPATRAEVAVMVYQALVYLGKEEPSDSEYIIRP